ncbi:MAG: DUF4240 domain-containing protein [Anaerolineae bacterium]|nr:DUF4240 domain-containing protein [Anaerolineae bacterium]
MNLSEFWQLIAQTHADSVGMPPRQFDRLVQTLVAIPVRDILDYDRIHETLMNRAYTSDVWNAAYMMTSCGDDSFSDFRGWLIAQGKATFEKTLHDPDYLAEVVVIEAREQCCWESLSYVASEAHWQKTGEDHGLPNYLFHPKLTGNVELIHRNEDYQKYYPKLWAKFSWLWIASDRDESDPT